MKQVKLQDSTYLLDIMEVEHSSFSIPWTKSMFTDELNKDIAHYIGAVDEDKLIGYGGFWKILDEGHITNIAVSPKYRKRGVGKMLILAIEDLCTDLGIICMTLEVRESNSAAIRLYESTGFKVFGKRKGYYEDNKEDALIMWKII